MVMIITTVLKICNLNLCIVNRDTEGISVKSYLMKAVVKYNILINFIMCFMVVAFTIIVRIIIPDV